MATSAPSRDISASDAPHLPLQDSPELRRALAAVDLPVLLMTYVHLSHDEAMLDKFAPHIPPLSTGQQPTAPDDLVAELREKMRHVLTTPGAGEEAELPPALYAKIMSVGMGEPIEAEFVPLLLEQSGLGPQPDYSAKPARNKIPADFRMLIIGAGLSGMAAAIKLREAGYDYVVVDKNPEVGGTWYLARYPGAGVDTPSYFYSYSFELNREWTTYSPLGHEMQDYLVGVSHKYGIRDKIRFETKVTTLRWDDAAKLWHVTLIGKDGVEQTETFNAILTAHGPLHRWEWPKIPGLHDFQGKLMHSAAWDVDFDVTGKKVAMIGTGASGAQIGPSIAPQVDELTVYMRSRHWVLPAPLAGAVKVPEDVRWAVRHIPRFTEYMRFYVYWTASDGLWPGLVMDPEWEGNPTAISFANDMARQWAQGHLEAKLAGRPDLIEKLTPDSPVFSKRPIMDAGWFDMFMRDNVKLEDRQIERITPRGIRTADGEEQEYDVIITATGYTLKKLAGGLEIIGLNGRNLGEEWGDEDPVGYFGTMAPGFPNYFQIHGPNSGPNHGAGINLLAEAQIHYIIECLDEMVERGASAMEPLQEATDQFNEVVQAQAQRMVWAHPKAKNNFKNSKGRIVISWPFRLLDFWTRSRKPEFDHFRFTGSKDG